MQPLESHTEQTVVDWWRKQKKLVFKLNLQGNRGWPDRMFLLPNGKVVFIEFKREGEKPEPLQEHHLRVLRQLGFEAYVCDNISDAKAILARAQISA